MAAAALLASCGGNRGAVSTSNLRNKPLAKKYSEMLGVKESQITNQKLYGFIDDWYGVPYKYGGKTKAGVDCSGFASALYLQVYARNMNGPAAGMYELCKAVSKNDLQEGDLVFFKINSKKISHVGVYLQNSRFVHASTKKGVIISDLNEDYYKKYFYKGGRPQGFSSK